MAEGVKKFGKYFLLDLVAQGGMAEIYRARESTLDGGGRLLAIKRIITSYSANNEFVTMFKAEIKTTSGFTHPNIVPLYEYGEEQGMLYIAMEYVEGKNLRQFMSRFAELKSSFPVEVCAYILEQAAHAMNYAHSYKDKFSGKNLNIVHRDISPQNILISYDGAVKVIDFGIAKAVTNVESTRAGVIKGKPSYLSPEQISGEALDGRSDIFALGIVFWELVTGRKLFASDNDYGVLKLIENCTSHVKPPSVFNTKVPKELDAIIMKCLQKDRDQRYANAEELQRALHKFLYQYNSDFNPADLAYYARDLFKNEIVEDRKRLLALNDRVEKLLAAEAIHQAKVKKENERPESTIALSEIPTDENTEDTDTDLSDRNKLTDDHTQTLNHALKNHQKPPAPPQTASQVGSQNAAKSSAVDLRNNRKQVTASGSFHMVDLQKAEKTNAIGESDGNQNEKTNVTLDYGLGNKPIVTGFATNSLQGAQAGRTRQLTNITKTSSAQKPQSSGLSAVAVILILILGGGFWFYSNQSERQPASADGMSVPTGTSLSLVGNVKAVTVTINDKVIGSSLPLQLKNLPIGKRLKLSVTANGFKRFTTEFILQNEENKTVNVQLVRSDDSSEPQPMANNKTVVMRINVLPLGIGTQIKLNGNLIDYSGVTSAPVGVPIDLVVERSGFRSVRKTVTIDPSTDLSKEYSIDISLEAARFGYVTIKTTPSAEAILNVDGIEEHWSTPISRRRIPIGTYKVKLVNSLLGMEKEITITVNEDRFTNIEERLSVTEEESSRVPSSK